MDHEPWYFDEHWAKFEPWERNLILERCGKRLDAATMEAAKVEADRILGSHDSEWKSKHRHKYDKFVEKVDAVLKIIRKRHHFTFEELSKPPPS